MTLQVVSSCTLHKHSYWLAPFLVLTITSINLLTTMIKLLQRTEILKRSIRYLFQQAEIGRLAAPFDGYPWTPTREYNCFFCRYKQTFKTFEDYEDCVLKHACNFSAYPIIDMNKTISYEEATEVTNPDGTLLTYQHTGIYKQVTFEGQPHHVQLFLCNNGQANCNASCFWHAWRLKNKKSWVKCGNAKLCQNDGSMWLQMAPIDYELFEEFIQQL